MRKFFGLSTYFIFISMLMVQATNAASTSDSGKPLELNLTKYSPGDAAINIDMLLLDTAKKMYFEISYQEPYSRNHNKTTFTGRVGAYQDSDNVLGQGRPGIISAASSLQAYISEHNYWSLQDTLMSASERCPVRVVFDGTTGQLLGASSICRKVSWSPEADVFENPNDTKFILKSISCASGEVDLSGTWLRINDQYSAGEIRAAMKHRGVVETKTTLLATSNNDGNSICKNNGEPTTDTFVFAKAETTCLKSDELIKLQKLQVKLEQMKTKKPGCENFRGAAACISPFDQSMMDYLLAKQAGDPQACQH